ncbi:hypothetical protein GCM10023088_68930 [Actinomadura verrucosospora]
MAASILAWSSGEGPTCRSANADRGCCGAATGAKNWAVMEGLLAAAVAQVRRRRGPAAVLPLCHGT